MRSRKRLCMKKQRRGKDRPNTDETNRQFRGRCPSLRATGNALVGLLAPEFEFGPAFSPQGIAAMAPKESAELFTLGYSGGAAPELHRRSLFVGPSHKKRPTTNARRNWDQFSNSPETVNRQN
jgi:hypothetical protein